MNELKCEKCEFTAKSTSGLKNHQRAKHGIGSGRSVRFDLNIRDKKQADELVEHMSNLICSQGWILLKQIIEGNVAVLEEAILDRKDPLTGEKMTEEELDDARRHRAIMIELVNKPDQLIEKFKEQGIQPLPSYDPYAMHLKESAHESDVENTLSTE